MRFNNIKLSLSASHMKRIFGRTLKYFFPIPGIDMTLNVVHKLNQSCFFAEDAIYLDIFPRFSPIQIT